MYPVTHLHVSAGPGGQQVELHALPCCIPAWRKWDVQAGSKKLLQGGLLEIAKDLQSLINLRIEEMEAVNYISTFPVVEKHILL